MSLYPYQNRLAPAGSGAGADFSDGAATNKSSGITRGGWGISSGSSGSNLSDIPTYNLPAFQKASALPNIKVPQYQAPGELKLPEFTSPDLQEYIKNIDIPGVKVDVPTIDKQYIKEMTQEYAAPSLAEERSSFRDALTEARKYSDNPAVVAKVIRDLMRSRGTGISKVLGSAGQTATNLEASNRANILNAAINNANLEQTRNLTKAKAETEISNKEIAEENERKYNAAMDLYQKTVADMLNQRNMESTYNNQAAMSQYDKLMADALSQRSSEQSYLNNAALHTADQNFYAEMAQWEAENKNNTSSKSSGKNSSTGTVVSPKYGSIGYPGNSWTLSDSSSKRTSVGG